MTNEILIPTLSLWQPWANALVVPHPKIPGRALKEYETRGWSTNVRGRILIHAAKKKLPIISENNLFKLTGQLQSVHGNKFPLGAIVGTVEIVEIITSEDFHKNGPNLSQTSQDEFWWGDWNPGRFGWKMANPIVFAYPIPCRGFQRFWNTPLSFLPEQYQSHFKAAA